MLRCDPDPASQLALSAGPFRPALFIAPSIESRGHDEMPGEAGSHFFSQAIPIQAGSEGLGNDRQVAFTIGMQPVIGFTFRRQASGLA
jgi:hypothetical protein